MSKQYQINQLKKVCKNGNIKLYDGYDVSRTNIRRRQEKQANYVTLFGNGINYGEKFDFSAYPVTSEIVQKECDKGLLDGILKSIESKGNDNAREILFNKYQNFETGISYDELLQVLRVELLECETEKLIKVGFNIQYDKQEGVYCEIVPDYRIQATGYYIDDNDGLLYGEDLQGALMSRLYGCISKYLYKFRQKDKKHLSYDYGDGDIIDMMDRKTLSKYVDVNELLQGEIISGFKSYVSANSKNSVTRCNIIDGLVRGLTYRQIANTYNIGISTINDNVVALKRLYKEFTSFSTNISWMYRKELTWLSLEDKKALETMGNRLLLEYCNYVFG